MSIDVGPFFDRKVTTSSLRCDCTGIVHDIGYGNDADCLLNRIIVTESLSLHRNNSSLQVSTGGFLVIGQTLIMLASCLKSTLMGGEKMSHIDCVNAALVAQDQKPLTTSLDAASLRSKDSPNSITIHGMILSDIPSLLRWQPSDTPCLSTPATQQHRQQAQADWLTRRADTGALAELFIWHYLQERYDNTLPLSSWVSSVKKRFYPSDRSRVNDALGADFEFVDTKGVFSSKRGSLIRAEVKGSVRSEVTQFEISRNELRGFNTSNSGGCEYVVILVANVASDSRPPCIYAVIRNPAQIQHLEPIQFLASFNMHQTATASGEVLPNVEEFEQPQPKKVRKEPSLSNSSWYPL